MNAVCEKDRTRFSSAAKDLESLYTAKTLQRLTIKRLLDAWSNFFQGRRRLLRGGRRKMNEGSIDPFGMAIRDWIRSRVIIVPVVPRRPSNSNVFWKL
jgi:hypothetical protein